MHVMTKGTALVLALVLCLCLAPAGIAEEIYLPATAEEALARLSIEVPPVPKVTVDDSNPQGRVFYIEGLDAWPLKDGSKLQSGAFIYNSYAEHGPYVPIPGREDEPLNIVIPEQWQGASLFMDLEGGSLGIINGELLVQIQLDLDGGSYIFNLDGTLREYSFQVSNDQRVFANYSADGLLNSYEYSYAKEDELKAYNYDAQGKIIDTLGLEKDGVGYYCIVGQWYYWNGNGYTPCEKPEGIELPAPAVLEPEEGIAQIEAKREAYLASMPALPPEEGAFPQSFDIESQFPAVPVLTQEELDDGSLRYVLTGLEPWGIEMRNDYVYAGSALFDYANAAVPGQVSLTIPADLISEWNENPFWRLTADVILTNARIGAYPNVRYYDWLDEWVFIVYVSPDAKYEIVLGSSPYVESFRYTLDGKEYYASYFSDGSLSYKEITNYFTLDGNEVQCFYTPQGAVESYELYAFADGASLNAEYDADGQLTVFYYYGNGLDYYFLPETNEWHDYSSDGDAPCEPPEGFDLTDWMTLDVSRLEPA